ncbi:MAG: spermidine/putrescine ABC transporter, partial [Angelakisella sp.]
MKRKNFSANLIILAVIVYLFIPLVGTAIYSLFNKWTEILPEQFTLENYTALLTEQDFLMSLVRTIIICIIPIFMTVVMVL